MWPTDGRFYLRCLKVNLRLLQEHKVEFCKTNLLKFILRTGKRTNWQVAYGKQVSEAGLHHVTSGFPPHFRGNKCADQDFLICDARNLKNSGAKQENRAARNSSVGVPRLSERMLLAQRCERY
jgi:hypothetical protein